MATNEEKLVSAFQEKVSIRSFFNLEICSAMSANDQQNVMSHTRITHDKFCSLKFKMAASWPFKIDFLTISEILRENLKKIADIDIKFEMADWR